MEASSMISSSVGGMFIQLEAKARDRNVCRGEAEGKEATSRDRCDFLHSYGIRWWLSSDRNSFKSVKRELDGGNFLFMASAGPAASEGGDGIGGSMRFWRFIVGL